MNINLKSKINILLAFLSVSVYGLGQRPRPQTVSASSGGGKLGVQNNGSSWNGPGGKGSSNVPRPQQPSQSSHWQGNGPNGVDDGRNDGINGGSPEFTDQWPASQQDSGQWDGQSGSGPKPKPNGTYQGSQWTGNGGNNDNDETHWEEQQKEHECSRIIPKNPKTIGLTQLVRVEKIFTSSYACDPDSRIKDLSYSNNATGPVTCNGLVVNINDEEYDITLISPKGKMRKEKLVITNFTQLQAFNNGNWEFTECGIIAAGRCAGDLFWGYGIYRADDPYGCQGEGISGQTAIVRRLEIKGKCGSKCSLGISTVIYSSPVSNQGIIDRALDMADGKDSD